MVAYENIREFAEAIIENHDWEGMEAVLYQDGEHWIRQSGSFGTQEDEIMVKMPLGSAYWSGSYFWGEDLEGNEELRESATDAVVEDISRGIEVWKEQEEERKALEDIIGL